MREFNSLKWISLCAVLSYASACDPGIDQDPVPSSDTVIAVYNPTARVIPLPNTAALDAADGTLPSLAGEEANALNEMYDYLGTYSGWSPATPIVVPFSGELDADSITDKSVVLYAVKGTEVTELESTASYVKNDENSSVCDATVCGSIITVSPKTTLTPGSQYAVLVTKDVQDTSGNSVREDAPVFFGLSKNAIYEDGEVKLNLFADDPTTAQSLEGIRQQLKPIVASLDLDRDTVASLFTWTVVKNGFTVLDAGAGVIPLPNTLAIEADGTFPSSPLNYCQKVPATEACVAPELVQVACVDNDGCTNAVANLGAGFQCVSGVCKNANCAQGSFDQYLDGLHGWPTTGVPITLPFTGELDESTLSPETVQLYKVVDGVPAKVVGYTLSLDPCGGQIVVTPPVDADGNIIPLGLSENYFAFATRGLKTLVTATDGTVTSLPMLPPTELYAAIQPYEVLIPGAACEAAMFGQACADDAGVCAPFAGEAGTEFKCGKSALVALNVDDATALRLHAVRPLLRGTTEVIEAATDFDYKDLSAVWSWYTWTDTFSVFDPTAGVIPFPNAFLVSGCPPEQPICNLPMGTDPLTMLLTAELATRPGFSTTAASWVPFIGPDPQADTITPDTVAFAETHVTPPVRLTESEYETSFLEGNVIVDFQRPLQKGTLVAGLVTSGVIGGNGFPVQPTPAFVFLRSQYPLVDADGNKTVSQIPDGAGPALEAARDQYKGLFSAAAIFGFDRTNVANSWAYTTQDTTLPIQELRALTIDQLSGGLPTVTAATPNVELPPFANGDGTTTLADQPGVSVDVSNLAAIHWDVEYDTYYWLDATPRLSLTMPTRQAVGVSVFIPATTASCLPPFDVAIVQHGHTSYRKRMSLAYANELAGRCIATVAMDLPLHGGRVPGSTSLHPLSNPADSGSLFVTQDFVAVKALFMQTAAELVVLTKLIKGGAFDAALGSVFSDNTSKIGYLGQSIGSFIGALFVTVEEDVESVVLNVGGGFFTDVLLESASFGPLFTGIGLASGSFAELQALHFIQWLADYVDPYSFAPYIKTENQAAGECGRENTAPCYAPLKNITYAAGTFSAGADLPSNEVMIQMVADETVVPNSTTELLAKTIGISLDDTTYPAGTAHGFISELDETDAVNGKTGACAREQGAAFLASNFAGTGTVITATECLNR